MKLNVETKLIKVNLKNSRYRKTYAESSCHMVGMKNHQSVQFFNVYRDVLSDF
jgi:hypothetical protein